MYCCDNDVEILLMEDILHQLIWKNFHYLQGFIHVRCCRISSINSMLKLLLLVLASHTCRGVPGNAASWCSRKSGMGGMRNDRFILLRPCKLPYAHQHRNIVQK